ncbi:Protein deltex-4 [Fukomys damarensis]|uniref:E3 ubiquitin-protein ligase n=1 Tax=Fukomys damarensis TaxID=885580 RepID=A0A091CVD9_FUKDA|nr:Protein deltex-4 [Fukomys damarensis]
MSRPGQGVMVPVNGLGFPPQNVARVVVWEWLNEHSRWRPYTATVCHHIENVLKEDARGSVVLGQVDAQLVPYIIDLQSMHQFRQDTGTMRPVRRNFYDPSSAPGKGIVWEWENDGGAWTAYDMDICITIQNAYEKQHPWLDLSSLGFCYLIYFNSMSQMNRQTRRRRRSNLGPCACEAGGGTTELKPWPKIKQNFKSSKPCSPGAGREAFQAWEQLVQRPRGRSCWPCELGKASIADVAGGVRSQVGNLTQQRQRIHVTEPYKKVPALPVKNLNGTGPVHPALAGMTGILLCAAGLPVCLTRAPKPILHPPPVSKSDVKPVPGVPGVCRKTKKKHLKKSKNPEDVVRRYMQKVKNPPDEDCTICMERLVTASGYEGDGSLQCPTCKAIYGEKTGTQPPGKMEFHLIPHSLPGFADTQTIRIVYDIPTGIQGPEHPNPGKKFTARGFPRHCYLPNNEKGRKVLRLLITAWERRLIFTVGTSNTTGESDTVVWNEIHHKTEFGSNLTGHGYPDASYLDNVLAELTAQGVSEAVAKA